MVIEIVVTIYQFIDNKPFIMNGLLFNSDIIHKDNLKNLSVASIITAAIQHNNAV